MFDWFGTKLTSLLDAYVVDVVAALCAAIAPLALTALTLWVLLYGWAVLRGEVHDSVQGFVWKAVKIGLVLAFALQAGFYVGAVSDTARQLAIGVATTFVPAGAPTGSVSSSYALLDQFSDQANKQVSDIMRDAGITRLDLMLAAVIFMLGTAAFLCVAVFVASLATVLLTFVVAVGPLFVLCLAWRPTQRFFDSWLSMLLNAVVLTWFVFFALGLSAFVGQQMFAAIEASGGFLGSTLNVLGEATRYCVLMIVMAIVCFQAPGLAAALTGGAAVQQGVQMVQNVLMVAGLRAVSTGAARPVAGAGAGGEIRPGAGLPYAAGRAFGAAGLSSARFAQTMAQGAAGVAQQGYRAARSAAYKLAALRARQ